MENYKHPKPTHNSTLQIHFIYLFCDINLSQVLLILYLSLFKNKFNSTEVQFLNN